MLDLLKWLRFPADNRILGAAGLAVVCSLTAQLPVVAASNMSAPISSTVVVPSRCSITTTTREIPRRDARAGSVVGAAVATCTRRPSGGAVTLQVSGGARNCQEFGIGQSTATVCGGSAAAAFARSLPQQRATETKAYVSLFMRGAPASATETAIITIDF
jgi:hypothetical protein